MHLLADPIAWLVVLLLSVLGVAGNLALYEVGKRGFDAIRERLPKVRPEQWQKVKALFDRFGAWALLLSGIPVLGSLLTTGAGAFGIPLPSFVVLVFVAKLVRNWLIVVMPIELYYLFAR